MRQGVGGAGGGDDIIDHGYVRAGEVASAAKGPLEVGTARATSESALRRRGADAAYRVMRYRHVQTATERACNLSRLIEAACGETLVMQRHGQDQIGTRGGAQIEVFAEREREGVAVRQMAAKLESMQQAINGPCIVESGVGGVEVGRLARAGAADRAWQRRQRLCALSASVVVPGQIAEAGRAEILGGTFTTQQTGGRNEAEAGLEKGL